MVMPPERTEVSCRCPGSRHQRLSFQLCYALGRAAPSGLEVLEAINVGVAPGRILIPNLVVVPKPGIDLTVWDPAEVAMIVEIVNPGSITADRAIKPQLSRLRASSMTCGSSSTARGRARRPTGCNGGATSKSLPPSRARSCAWLSRSEWTSTSPTWLPPPPARQSDGRRSLE
ncbi:MAG: Uma2 family endonuclease [Pseudonocardiales bacterium]|nr:Uma2 family endonuclease [Pseudonocardiales bacterium]